MTRNCFLDNLSAVCVCAAVVLSGCGGGSKKTSPIILNPPASVSASDGLYDNKVTISWTAVDGAEKYNVYRSDTVAGTYILCGSSVTLSYTDSPTAYKVAYFYKVSTVSSTGNEGGMNENPDSGYTDAVTEIYLNATTHLSDRVSLSWSSTNSTETFLFNVYRGTSLTGSFDLIADKVTGTTYDDMSAVKGKLYYYKLKSVSAMGSIGDFSSAPSGYALLDAPLNVAASEGTSTSYVTITWSPVENAVAYKVYRASIQSDTYYTLISTSNVAGITYNDTSISAADAAQDRYYKVSAVSADALVGFQSASDVGYVGLNVPGNVQASDAKYYNSIKITWAAVPSAGSYEVYRDNVLLNTVSGATSYKDTSADTSSHSYKVRAVKSSSSSRYSAFSTANDGIRKNTAESQTFEISWAANRETMVNQADGGYNIYSSGALIKNVPYVSGTYAPTSADITFNYSDVGSKTLTVKAYSILNPAGSAASASIIINVE